VIWSARLSALPPQCDAPTHPKRAKPTDRPGVPTQSSSHTQCHIPVPHHTSGTRTYPRGQEDVLGGLGVIGLGVSLRPVHQVEMLRRGGVDESAAALALRVCVWVG
jgi:hypothetical protein